VQYHKVNAMLLNEVQKQHRKILEQEARLAALEALVQKLLPPAAAATSAAGLP